MSDVKTSDLEDELGRDIENKLAEATKEVAALSMISQLRTFTEMLKGIDRDLQAIDEEVGLRIASIRKRLGSLT
jgi:hypothetical protein